MIKRLLLAVTLALTCAAPVTFTSCASSPSSRVVEVQSLKATGQTAEAAVMLSARLYQGGTITATQARAVLDLYDLKFQPAFRVAVAAAHTDLNQLSPREVANLAAQIVNLVNSYRTP